MKLDQIVLEANIAAKLKDPKTVKMLGIAMRHDGTLPRDKVAKLGPKPDDQDILQLWSELLDASLRNTDYGDISADGKFDDWLTRLYTNGVVDYEDINGEGGDALGAWKALSIRGKLKEPHQDFNKFKNLRQIQQIIRDNTYRDELRRIKDSEVIEKHKREKKETTLIDNERFLVTLPYNYGACYTFNNSVGIQANFCTGSSSGLSWFNRYSPDGPIVSIVDKSKMNEVEGKWQLHAPTHQLVDAEQNRRHDTNWNDERFSKLFPGLMKDIGNAMTAKAEEINAASKEITNGKGYDVAKAVSELQKTYPLSWASSTEEKDEPEGEEDPGPGIYLVTQLASGKQARIEGESRADIVRKLTTRYPDSTEADYTIEKQD